MIVVILLLILAVLLFGSSVVTGVIGAIFGFLVTVVAFIYLKFTFGLTLANILLYGFGFVVLAAIMVFSFAALYDHFNPPEKLMQKYEEEREKKLALMSLRERDAFLKDELKRAELWQKEIENKT